MRPLTQIFGIALCLLFAPAFNCSGPAAPPLAETEHSCVGAEAAPPPADGMAAVVIGSGEEAGFVPLEDGVTLVREQGPQGGTHVTIALRLFADDENAWLYDSIIENSEGEIYAQSSVSANACPGAWVESRNVRVFVNAAEPFSGILRVEALPSDTLMPRATAELQVSVP